MARSLAARALRIASVYSIPAPDTAETVPQVLHPAIPLVAACGWELVQLDNSMHC